MKPSRFFFPTLMISLACLFGCLHGPSRFVRLGSRTLDAATIFKNPFVLELLDRISAGRPLTPSLRDTAILNAEGAEGLTPLFWFVLKEDLASFERLLVAGADPNVVTVGIDGESVFEYLSINAPPEFMEIALKHGAHPQAWPKQRAANMFCSVTSVGPEANAYRLMNLGIDLNVAHENGPSPFGSAITALRFKLARDMLYRGADYLKFSINGRTDLDSLCWMILHGEYTKSEKNYLREIIEVIDGRGDGSMVSAEVRAVIGFK